VVAVDAGDSSQYLSALAMAGARARGPLTIEVERLVSTPYVDLTVAAMREFGVRIERPSASRVTVEPGFDAPAEYEIEADFSSACYFAAAAALTGGRVELQGVREESKQGDRRFLAVLGRMGATVDWPASDRTIVTGGGSLVAVDEDMSQIPDQVPTLAAIAPFARGVTRIDNVAHLRIKESDRLAACASELERLGAGVIVRPDGGSMTASSLDSARAADSEGASATTARNGTVVDVQALKRRLRICPFAVYSSCSRSCPYLSRALFKWHRMSYLRKTSETVISWSAMY